MKVFSSDFVTEYEEVVTYQPRTFWQWLLNKPLHINTVKREEYSKLKDVEFESIQELLFHFVKTKKKGQSSNFCCMEKGVHFYLSKGKNRIGVQCCGYGPNEVNKKLQELQNLFGQHQFIGDKKYEIVYNVVDAEKQSKAALEKNARGK